MFRLRSQQRKAGSQKRKQLWGKDFDIVKNGLDEEQVIDFVNGLVIQQGSSSPDSARSIIQTAIKGAEKIINSIKARARAEAEEEAARIIAQAKQEAVKGKGDSNGVVEKVVEDILSVANKVTERRIEEPVQVAEETSGEEIEEVTQPGEEAIETELIEVAEKPLGQSSPEEREEKKRAEPSLSKSGKQTLYTGEVELDIGVPVTPTMMAKLYNYLQTTPEI
jgi:hypothetical protein